MIFSCNRFAIIPHMCHECKDTQAMLNFLEEVGDGRV